MGNCTHRNLPLSNRTKHLDFITTQLKKKYKQLWWETNSSMPNFPNTYSPKNQKEIENKLANFVNSISKSMENYSHSQVRQKKIMHNLINQSKFNLRKMTQSSGLYFDEDFNNGIKKSSKTFLEKIKQYDPSIEIKYIYQAMRNLWIMNSL